MPISKSTATVETPKADVAQTAPAPVSRKLDTGITPVENKKTYQGGRDYDAEARGKVACVAFNAALASPGIAGLPFANFDEYITLVRKAADASVAYTWQKQQSGI